MPCKNPESCYQGTTFIRFPKTSPMARELQVVNGYREKATVDALVQLLDLIKQPVIMMVNSGMATSGWAAADRRARQIKGILAVEPWAPAAQPWSMDRRRRRRFPRTPLAPRPISI